MSTNLPSNNVKTHDYITNDGRRFLLKNTKLKDLIIRRHDDLTIYQFHQTEGVVNNDDAGALSNLHH